MISDLLTIFFRSAEGAFIQVTVFVGVVLLIFGYIDYKGQGAFINAISNAKKLQPLVGALLGILPGCGGSILIMPLYVKNTVSFGTVVATLIATAGDSAFLTLTKAPQDFLFVTALCLIIGTAAGYAVDYYKIGNWVRKKSTKKKITDLKQKHKAAEAQLDALLCDNPGYCRSHSLKHIGHEEGDEIDMILHHGSKPAVHKGYKITHKGYVVFWVVVAIGFVLGIFDLVQLDINQTLGVPGFSTIIGIIGSAIVVIYMICSSKLIKAQTHEDVEHKIFSLKETLIHNAQETAFVGTWVFFAYFAYELLVFAIGGEQTIINVMAASGLMSVLLGVAIGIIPGCGPQVIFVSLYLKGMFPFSALFANAISQDGDALFPLIALDKKAAFWATVVNTIVALIVGVAAYFIEISLT